MLSSLSDLFPESKIKLDPSVFQPSLADLENNTFFNHLVQQIIEEHSATDNKNNKNRNNVPFRIKDFHLFT
jgi:hypothetical protein